MFFIIQILKTFLTPCVGDIASHPHAPALDPSLNKVDPIKRPKNNEQSGKEITGQRRASSILGTENTKAKELVH